jgi:hypothetical protein
MGTKHMYADLLYLATHSAIFEVMETAAMII